MLEINQIQVRMKKTVHRNAVNAMSNLNAKDLRSPIKGLMWLGGATSPPALGLAFSQQLLLA
jgi:hypothetical protein